jgi:hypothetical protein
MIQKKVVTSGTLFSILRAGDTGVWGRPAAVRAYVRKTRFCRKSVVPEDASAAQAYWNLGSAP